MKNSEYWEERIANETWTVYNTLEEKNRALMDMYQEATLDIQNELYSIAQKVNGGQSLSLSDMHKYNRLKSLQNNIENRIEQLGKDTEKFGKDNMKEGFKEVYSNIRKELGETSFSMPNEKVMLKMMNNPWRGSNFSKRLWKNTGVLASNLNEILTIGLTQGKTVTEMAIQLGNRMNQGFNTAHKLIRTETMHYLNESAYKAYKDGGCEEVQLWAAEDERTCEVCGKRHGKKYKIDKRPVLPFHPNCRCTYLPVINSNREKGDKKRTSDNNIRTVSDAQNALINNVGLSEVEESFIKNVDPELIIRNTKQLKKLEDKYGVIHSSNSTTICSVNKDRRTVAFVSSGETNPTRQNLSLCSGSYNDYKKFIKNEKIRAESGYIMPIDLNEEELSICSITHEYGHMIQNKLVEDEMRANGWTPNKPMAFINTKRKTKDAMFKWYTDINFKVKKQCYDEIIAIAKKYNSNFKFDDNISKYGKSSYEEFFAEVFMNSELSKPNELGIAMKIWLKEKKLMNKS